MAIRLRHPSAPALVPFSVESGVIRMAGTVIRDGTITAAKMSVTELSAIAANLGTVTGGLFRTAASGMRAEVGEGTYPFWFGTGTKNDANARFYVKNNGDAYFAGVLAANVVKTTDLQANAVSLTDYVRNGTDRTMNGGVQTTVIQSNSIVIPDVDGAGGLVNVIISFSVMSSSDNASAPSVTWDVFRARQSVSGTLSASVWSQALTGGWQTPNWHYTVRDQVAPGTYRWSARVTVSSSRLVHDAVMTIQVLKK